MDEYSFNYVVDGLPAAQIYIDESTGEKFYNAGIPLGDITGIPVLHNHFNIYIHYHPRENDKIRVVGVVINPQRYPYY